MTQLKIVLCPIDFSDLARRELELAVRVCDVLGAHLVLHHNRSAASMGLTRTWEWNETQRAIDGSMNAEERLRHLAATLPASIPVTSSVSEGPVGLVLLEMARQLPADLIVMGSHGWSTPNHASLTERIMEESPCPVLTIHDGISADRFRMGAGLDGKSVCVVVPTDLEAPGQRAMDHAFELARRADIQLHLLHVTANGKHGRADEVTRALISRVPPDLAERTRCHLAQGNTIEHVMRMSRELDASFIVMGKKHTGSLFARLFTRDPARELLHRAPCPVWFVP